MRKGVALALCSRSRRPAASCFAGILLSMGYAASVTAAMYLLCALAEPPLRLQWPDHSRSYVHSGNQQTRTGRSKSESALICFPFGKELLQSAPRPPQLSTHSGTAVYCASTAMQTSILWGQGRLLTFRGSGDHIMIATAQRTSLTARWEARLRQPRGAETAILPSQHRRRPTRHHGLVCRVSEVHEPHGAADDSDFGSIAGPGGGANFGSSLASRPYGPAHRNAVTVRRMSHGTAPAGR